MAIKNHNRKTLLFPPKVSLDLGAQMKWKFTNNREKAYIIVIYKDLKHFYQLRVAQVSPCSRSNFS
jgi:hypothetical protein